MLIKKLMRYNNYKVDPLSKNDPEFSIASRMDLDVVDPLCFGATDSKLISVSQFKQSRKINIISGPTSDQQPAFNVNNATCAQNPKFTFVGMPDIYDFDWVEYSAKQFN